MRSEGKDVLEAIRAEQKLTDEIEAQLKAQIDAYAKAFA
jgi:F-type H+-transporting ATPase subunit alpha